MNLREFWAAEAAKLRDTSEILGVPKLSEAAPNLNKSIEDISTGYESVTACVVPNGWRTDFVNLASANTVRTSADIADIAAMLLQTLPKELNLFLIYLLKQTIQLI
jgi:uncharacterized protein (DUF1800 family)